MSFSDEEHDALDAAQTMLERDRRMRSSVQAVVWTMVATLALAVAAFFGWYLRSIQ